MHNHLSAPMPYFSPMHCMPYYLPFHASAYNMNSYDDHSYMHKPSNFINTVHKQVRKVTKIAADRSKSPTKSISSYTNTNGSNTSKRPVKRKVPKAIWVPKKV